MLKSYPRSAALVYLLLLATFAVSVAGQSRTLVLADLAQTLRCA